MIIRKFISVEIEAHKYRSEGKRRNAKVYRNKSNV
jgi:hypothetical protein